MYVCIHNSAKLFNIHLFQSVKNLNKRGHMYYRQFLHMDPLFQSVKNLNKRGHMYYRQFLHMDPCTVVPICFHFHLKLSIYFLTYNSRF